MSSFLGHSVTALTVYIATEPINSSVSILSSLKCFFKRRNYLWLFWLIIIASIPDLDYLVKAWQSSNNQGIRITHSIIFSLIMPSFTIAVLIVIGVKGKKLKIYSLQSIFAGLSHLFLDLFVGVTPLPLLLPVIDIPLKLPFGILPSAGKIDFNNYYFYRNLKLEMGILLPLLILVCISRQKLNQLINIAAFFASLICLYHFIKIYLALPR